MPNLRQSSNFRTLRRNYQQNVLITGVVLVLALLISSAVLLSMRQDALLDATRAESAQLRLSLEDTVDVVREHLHTMRKTVEYGLARPSSVVAVGPDWKPEMGALHRDPKVAIDPKLLQRDLSAISRFLVGAAATHQWNPIFQWTYFFDKAARWMLIYPVLDDDEALRVTKTNNIGDAVKVLIDADGINPVRMVAPENNPKREMLWTLPYKDSAGKGMMVTLLTPIYLGDEYIGAMGTDMTLKALTATLSEHAPVFGRALVVDSSSNVLADTGAALAKDGERVKLGQVFPDLPSGIDSISPSDRNWLRYPIKGTPCFLIVKVPHSELRNRALQDISPYLGIALAMVIGLLAAAGMAYRRYSQPAMRLAQYVDECNGSRVPDVPTAPDVWMPLYEQVANTNRERLRLLDTAQAQAEELERKVTERTGELQAANAALQDTVASLEQTRQDLVRADRVGALGGLIAGVANEVAGPLDQAAQAAQRFNAGIDAFKENLARGLRKAELDAFVAEADAAGKQAAAAVSGAVELLGRFKQLALDQADNQIRLFALRDVVDNVLAAMRPALALHDTEVQNRIDASIALEADAGKLGQILRHLLADTIARVAATGAQGRIELLAGLNTTPEGERIALTLRDNGRSAAAPQAGQTIVAAILEAMPDATLEVVSSNEGSRIVLTLPKGGE